jgi:hypothetical protein
VSEKEQATALKLLSDLLRVVEGHALSADDQAVVSKAKAFLALPVVGPESHGNRRS